LSGYGRRLQRQVNDLAGDGVLTTEQAANPIGAANTVIEIHPTS
jgi:hypothetical protein